MPPLSSPHGLRQVLGAGVFSGLIAGLATGAIDALWSWGPAAQFATEFFARVRFVVFSSVMYAAAGAVLGLVLAAVALVLSRETRLGDLVRLGWREHIVRRDRDQREAVAGLALVLVALPCIAVALYLAYWLAVPYLTGRKVVTERPC